MNFEEAQSVEWGELLALGIGKLQGGIPKLSTGEPWEELLRLGPEEHGVERKAALDMDLLLLTYLDPKLASAQQQLVHVDPHMFRQLEDYFANQSRQQAQLEVVELQVTQLL